VYTRSAVGIGVYVDDLLVVDESLEEIGKFKLQMNQSFHMSDLGNLSYYLGIEFKQGRHEIELYQSACTAKLLDRVGLGSCNGCAAPIESRLKLSKRSSSPLVDAMTYSNIIWQPEVPATHVP
jgi:hypothetical protein